MTVLNGLSLFVYRERYVECTVNALREIFDDKYLKKIIYFKKGMELSYTFQAKYLASKCFHVSI